MTQAALIDSSAFLALEDPDEISHSDTRDALDDLVAGKVRLFATEFIFDEAYTLIMSKLGRRRAIEWGQGLRESRLIQTLRVDPDHIDAAWSIVVDYEHDFSFTDATTFAVAGSLNIDTALSLDRHFHQYGKLRVLP